MENFWTYFEVLAPSVGVGLLFWLAMRSIFRADRKERTVESQVREEYAPEYAAPEQRAGSAEDSGTSLSPGQNS